jgi:hypothetical protein
MQFSAGAGAKELDDTQVAPFVRSRAIRCDLRTYLLSVEPDDMVEAAQELSTFRRPVLVVWTSEDEVMNPEHGSRFARLLAEAIQLSSVWTSRGAGAKGSGPQRPRQRRTRGR